MSIGMGWPNDEDEVFTKEATFHCCPLATSRRIKVRPVTIVLDGGGDWSGFTLKESVDVYILVKSDPGDIGLGGRCRFGRKSSAFGNTSWIGYGGEFGDCG